MEQERGSEAFQPVYGVPLVRNHMVANKTASQNLPNPVEFNPPNSKQKSRVKIPELDPKARNCVAHCSVLTLYPGSCASCMHETRAWPTSSPLYQDHRNHNLCSTEDFSRSGWPSRIYRTFLCISFEMSCYWYIVSLTLGRGSAGRVYTRAAAPAAASRFLS